MNITLLIIAVTCIISFVAFSNASLLENLLFYPYRMWRNKEWHRLVSNGFVHADITHLLFNMFALFSFGGLHRAIFRKYFRNERTDACMYLMYFGAIATADLWNSV
jgi:membrane associated rhomboid family serine protease